MIVTKRRRLNPPSSSLTTPTPSTSSSSSPLPDQRSYDVLFHSQAALSFLGGAHETLMFSVERPHREGVNREHCFFRLRNQRHNLQFLLSKENVIAFLGRLHPIFGVRDQQIDEVNRVTKAVFSALFRSKQPSSPYTSNGYTARFLEGGLFLTVRLQAIADADFTIRFDPVHLLYVPDWTVRTPPPTPTAPNPSPIMMGPGSARIDLSTELLLSILSFFPPRWCLLTFGLLCRRFSAIAFSDGAWKGYCYRTFPKTSWNHVRGGDWQRFYRQRLEQAATFQNIRNFPAVRCSRKTLIPSSSGSRGSILPMAYIDGESFEKTTETGIHIWNFRATAPTAEKDLFALYVGLIPRSAIPIFQNTSGLIGDSISAGRSFGFVLGIAKKDRFTLRSIGRSLLNPVDVFSSFLPQFSFEISLFVPPVTDDRQCGMLIKCNDAISSFVHVDVPVGDYVCALSLRNRSSPVTFVHYEKQNWGDTSENLMGRVTKVLERRPLRWRNAYCVNSSPSIIHTGTDRSSIVVPRAQTFTSCPHAFAGISCSMVGTYDLTLRVTLNSTLLPHTVLAYVVASSKSGFDDDSLLRQSKTDLSRIVRPTRGTHAVFKIAVSPRDSVPFGSGMIRRNVSAPGGIMDVLSVQNNQLIRLQLTRRTSTSVSHLRGFVGEDRIFSLSMGEVPSPHHILLRACLMHPAVTLALVSEKFSPDTTEMDTGSTRRRGSAAYGGGGGGAYGRYGGRGYDDDEDDDDDEMPGPGFPLFFLHRLFMGL